jgi:hypothetical protein
VIYPKETKSLFVAIFYDDSPLVIPIIAENIIQAEELMQQKYKESINYTDEHEIKGPYKIPALGPLFIVDTLNMEVLNSEEEYLHFIGDSGNNECFNCDNVPPGINIPGEIQDINEEIIL